MRIPRVVVLWSVVALGLVGITGCGGSGGGGDAGKSSNVDKDAKALVTEAGILLRDGDFEITGDVVQESIRTDYNVCVHAARDVQGTAVVLEHKAEVVVVGGKSYLMADAPFWRAYGSRTDSADQAEIDRRAALIAGKYMMTAADPEDPIEGIGSILGDANLTYVTGETSEIGGKRVVALKAEQRDGTTRTVHVPAEGKPYPVKVQVDGADPVNLVFARAEKACTPVTPPTDRTIDMDEPDA
ncbi:hypothetical protein [Embleya sp. NPDC050493]|uniref:hypothetical protein n=1 Tax=Embleya sp. NPDC050493 TaxID=3363989 RepID=UPI0037B5CE25